MTEASATRRRLDPAARRELILDAATAFFAEVGFDGPTRDLARRAGVTQALLYRYFPSKRALAEEVYDRVYLARLDPAWLHGIRDRAVPIEARLRRFYVAYTRAIFTAEWMRIFMWAGLAGDALNRRYLDRVAGHLLDPLAEEIAAAGFVKPGAEDMWNLHGGIVYFGIRRFIYRLPTPDDAGPAIELAIARFLRGQRALSRPAPEARRRRAG